MFNNSEIYQFYSLVGLS